MSAPYADLDSFGTEPTDRGRLLVRVHRPAPRTAVVVVAGEVDIRTAPHLAEVVECRLRGTGRVVVVDLTGVTFLAVAALKALRHLSLLARELGVTFLVDPGSSYSVRRLLELSPVDCIRPGYVAALVTTEVPAQRTRG
ncbi:STAS domain-containing protein [Amycolatopsis rhabdoformis]|uniref:STAS domain-containing protein n=1 Tax=Amycolatopsis rhabdoformis TaxID=1448059 RepID=A0ABZ1HX28_9PSEU|nr:STAS domain-containing protein [Amycolatopsis rhabdoformis]WSE26683.1 STAS domain-containing protein [Amycolatopsis rhabdoformis]